jgi:hypothetical protein
MVGWFWIPLYVDPLCLCSVSGSGFLKCILYFVKLHYPESCMQARQTGEARRLHSHVGPGYPIVNWLLLIYLFIVTLYSAYSGRLHMSMCVFHLKSLLLTWTPRMRSMVLYERTVPLTMYSSARDFHNVALRRIQLHAIHGSPGCNSIEVVLRP